MVAATGSNQPLAGGDRPEQPAAAEPAVGQQAGPPTQGSTAQASAHPGALDHPRLLSRGQRHGLTALLILGPVLGLVAAAIAGRFAGTRGVVGVCGVAAAGVAVAVLAICYSKHRVAIAVIGVLLGSVVVLATSRFSARPLTQEPDPVVNSSSVAISPRPSATLIDLAGRDLRGSDFHGANLRRAMLRGTQLEMANLRGADLREACLRGADLTGADLSGALLDGADLTDTKFSTRPPITKPQPNVCSP